ncbi:glycosyltransferase involved in cell wall biosynthesis [Azospirillum picis]|uniref:Glycosyltransferase involved in cell wall biosynthesis n=2 Tax=Azospirillum picis TaxID=488438 RepID=A0ABU0MGQ1_9PROT|nr:glycosyltransferase involved in cell wall biosynthesis [Azospirillum picis]MDQ0532599.1 glycosyltransferase involved in cell wall biosynthesis [Azospirillum picis]
MLALAGPLLAARHRAVTLHWCQDLYPDLLPVLGIRIPAGLHRLARVGMAQALRRHDGVIAIGGCMRDRLAGLGVPDRCLTVLPNWPDPVIRPLPRAGNRYRRSLGMDDGDGRFLVVYSGVLGLAHPMDGLLDAARRLQDSDPAVMVLLAGDGRGMAAVERTASALGLRNLRRLPWQPAAQLGELLAAADLHLVSMASDAQGLLVPSKLAGIQAAGRPCLFLGPSGSECARRIGGCGLTVDPFDGEAIAAAVRAYAADPGRVAAEGQRAARQAEAWTLEQAAAAFTALAGARLAAPPTAGIAAGWRVPHA